jgi:hypothetical protein
MLSLAVIGTAVLSASLLGRTAGFELWLAPLAIALSLLTAGAVMLPHISARAGGPARLRVITRIAALAGLVAILAGPASYSLATVGRSVTGSNPLGGPAAVENASALGAGRPAGGGPPGAPGGRAAGPAGGAPRGLQPKSARRPAGNGARSGPGGGMNFSASKATINYLESHQANARYLVAAVGSKAAASIALQSGRNVIDMGGFMGSDPSPSLSQIEQLVKSGQLHYVLLNAAGNGAGAVGFSTSTTRARNSWIETHGKVVKVPGETNAGLTLYYLSSAA